MKKRERRHFVGRVDSSSGSFAASAAPGEQSRVYPHRLLKLNKEVRNPGGMKKRGKETFRR